MPRGLALASLSGMLGSPVLLEKRTKTGNCLEKWSDFVIVLAASVGVNVPLSNVPLAWAGLKPGCSPNILSNTAINSLASALTLASSGSGIRGPRIECSIV